MEIIIKDKKVYRRVDNIENFKKLIAVFEAQNLLGNEIVETKIIDVEKNLLEHPFINPIIHSGEFTTSMAYDIMKCALNMAINLVDLGIFAFDLFPHQYTYIDGQWFLYDFDAFNIHPKNIKTQVRGTYKIVFSSFELLKILTRAEMKHCFLNRITNSTFYKMVDFKNWILWFLKQTYCMFLFNLGLYQQTYKQLKKYFKEYDDKHSRKLYSFSVTDEELGIYSQIDDILTSQNIKNTFLLGEKSAQWAIKSMSDIKKFVYLDDYDLCDEYYNFIYQNNYKEISTAVIYPFMQDKEINLKYSYRGVYDYFAKERFYADAVLILNSNELYMNREFDVKEFCNNIVEFSTKLYIHKFNKNTEFELAQKIQTEMHKYYYNVEFIETANSLILIGKDKQLPLRDYSSLPKYLNGNRGAEAKQQSCELLKILKNNKNS